MYYKKKYKKYFSVFIFIISIFSSIGCEKQINNSEIKFIEENTIEYTKEFKISSLIESVDGYTSTDFNITDDKVITLPNGKTVSINVDNKEIKLDTIKFRFKYNNKNFTKEILIEDTTAPIINSEETYNVTVGNKYFDLKKIISADDNYTNSNDIELFYNGDYDINKVGTYEIEVIAYDEKKNKATKIISVIVEGEKEEEKTSTNESSSASNGETIDNNSINNSNNSNSNESEIINKPSEESNSTVKPNYQPIEKMFTIDTYSNFEECYQECQKYIVECMNNGYQGIASAEPIKRDDVYIGYKAIFR